MRQRLLGLLHAWDKALFVLALAAAIFFAGIEFRAYQLFPAMLSRDARQAIEDWAENWQHYLQIRPEKHLRVDPKPRPQPVYEAGKAWDGVTLLSGFVEDQVGLILVDMTGRRLHAWKVRVSTLWEPTSPVYVPDHNDWDVILSGAHLFENGDVLFSHYKRGLVRIDRCGRVLWKAPYRTHHSLDFADDGTIWAPSEIEETRTYTFPNDRILHLIDPEVIQQFSPKGTLLRQIDLVDVLLAAGLGPVVFGTRLIYQGLESSATGQGLTHLNDVEVLSAEDAAAFPQFEAGDLLVSLRSPSLVFVLDPETLAVRWFKVDGLFGQHDPDFLPDGRISIFDNIAAVTARGYGKGSRIIAVNPATDAVETLYQTDPMSNFFTLFMGSHQHLPNGNILITESFRGRVFEVTEQAEIVWQFVNAWDDERIILTYQAKRYPASFGAFAREACPQTPGTR